MSGRTVLATMRLAVLFYLGSAAATWAVPLSLKFVGGRCEGTSIADNPIPALVATVTFAKSAAAEGTLPATQSRISLPTDAHGYTTVDSPTDVRGSMISIAVSKGYSVRFPKGGVARVPIAGPITFVVDAASGKDSSECSPSALAMILLDSLARSPLGTSSTGSYAAGPSELSQRNSGELFAKLRDQKDPLYSALVDLYQGRSASTIKLLQNYKSYDSQGADAAKQADVAFALGKAFFNEEQYSEAAEQFRLADYYRPGEPVVLVDRATSLSLAGLDADAAFTRAREFMNPETEDNKPLRATLLLSYGIYLMEHGNQTEAEVEFKGALSLEESLPGREESKATIHLQLSILQSTVSAVEEELKTANTLLKGFDSNTSAIVKYSLADYYALRGGLSHSPQEKAEYFEKAEELFEAACKRFQENSIGSAACLASYARERVYRGDCNEALKKIQNLNADKVPKTQSSWQKTKEALDFVRAKCPGKPQ